MWKLGGWQSVTSSWKKGRIDCRSTSSCELSLGQAWTSWRGPQAKQGEAERQSLQYLGDTRSTCLQTSSFFHSSNFPLTYLGSGSMLQFSYSSPSLSHTHAYSRPQLNPTSPTAGSRGARVSLPGWELPMVKHTCPCTPVSPRPAECLAHGEPSARTYRLEAWIHTLSAFGGCVPSTSFKTTKGKALVFLQSCFLDHFPPTKYF